MGVFMHALRGCFEKEGGGGCRGEGEPRDGSHLAPRRKSNLLQSGLAHKVCENILPPRKTDRFPSGGDESTQLSFRFENSEIDRSVVQNGRKRLVYNGRKSVVYFGRLLTRDRWPLLI